MKTFIYILSIALALMTFLPSVTAKRSDDFDDSSHEIKGKIEQVADERPGVWIVNGYEITVTETTVIDEEHGKAVTGAFVEVKGTRISGTFFASRIEVKKIRKTR